MPIACHGSGCRNARNFDPIDRFRPRLCENHPTARSSARLIRLAAADENSGAPSPAHRRSVSATRRKVCSAAGPTPTTWASVQSNSAGNCARVEGSVPGLGIEEYPGVITHGLQAAVTILGIGNDLIDIRHIEKTTARFGDRFLDRVFTPLKRQVSDHHANRAESSPSARPPRKPARRCSEPVSAAASIDATSASSISRAAALRSPSPAARSSACRR